MTTAVRGAANSPRRIVPGLAAKLDEFHRTLFLPLVRRAAWRHGLSKEDARDVVQEAFLLAVMKLDPKRNAKAWLTQVVDNLSVNLRRTGLRRAQLAALWGAAARDEEAESFSDEDSGGSR